MDETKQMATADLEMLTTLEDAFPVRLLLQWEEEILHDTKSILRIHSVFKPNTMS